MLELNVSDIMQRLRDLRCYSERLSEKMEHEEELPNDPVPFLVNKLEQCYLACEKATGGNNAVVNEELFFWLTKSYRFYLTRLAMQDDAPWIFTFPKAAPCKQARGQLH